MGNSQVTVLVVEDHKAFRDILVKILGLSRYRVLAAEIGKAGLETAKREKPDVIILDIMMPGMDGYETCRQFRATPETAQTPVIILTALTGENVQANALRAGANVCLTKPCSIADLETAIQEQLDRTASQRT